MSESHYLRRESKCTQSCAVLLQVALGNDVSEVPLFFGIGKRWQIATASNAWIRQIINRLCRMDNSQARPWLHARLRYQNSKVSKRKMRKGDPNNPNKSRQHAAVPQYFGTGQTITEGWMKMTRTQPGRKCKQEGPTGQSLITTPQKQQTRPKPLKHEETEMRRHVMLIQKRNVTVKVKVYFIKKYQEENTQLSGFVRSRFK